MWSRPSEVSGWFSICYALDMTAEQLISLNLKTYLSMKERCGKDDPEVAKLYGKLKDMIIVEIYFMGFLRNLLNDDEMSGFILYINDDLDDIIDSFRKDRGHFMCYLKDSLENRAMAYLNMRVKRYSMRTSYIDFHKPDILSVAEASPEEVYINRENAVEAGRRKAVVYNALRNMCIRVKSRREKLFTFFCTVVPFLSRDVIDGFCESINCDRRQTLMIAKHLCRIQARENDNRYSKFYMSRMIDFHWAKILEYEGHAKLALDPEPYRKKADLNRKRLKESIRGFSNAKMNASYSAVADILNLDPKTVALYVMYAKKILERVMKNVSLYDERSIASMNQYVLPRFEPFVVFGIRNRC